jgi:hypothetical protein
MEYMGEHLFGGWNPMKSVYFFDRGSSLLSGIEAIINHGFPVHEVISGKRVQFSKCCMIQFLGIWQILAMSQKLRLADCFDCFVRIWQFPGFPVLGHIQYRSFLCLYDSDGPFSLWHYGTGMVHLLSKSHPSANRRWCRSAMHSWRNARHIHEAAYTLASNCSVSNDYCW